MDKDKGIEQTKLAFELIQKLYYETAFLIKEIEGQLSEEPEEFVIGKPSGYSINTRSSTRLDAKLINYWLLRKLSVFFSPAEFTKHTGGVTTTETTPNTKVIYFRVVLDDNNNKEPKIIFGVLNKFEDLTQNKYSKIEKFMAHIDYREKKVFQHKNKIQYQDGSVKFSGKLKQINLFDLKDSKDVNQKIIIPVLKMFRGQ